MHPGRLRSDEPALRPDRSSLQLPCVRAREPLFTVVLPTHNRHAFLDEAVASVLAQTVSDFELVVVDDGSPEPTSVPDDRVRLVRLPTNQGPAVARNAGMAVAAGLYLAFLDDDDLYTPDRLELAQDGLRRAPVALCWTRFHDQPPGSNRRLEGDVGDVIRDPLPRCNHHPSGQRPRFDDRWAAVEDVDWWIRVATSTPVTTVPSVGYLVRRHGDPTITQRGGPAAGEPGAHRCLR